MYGFMYFINLRRIWTDGLLLDRLVTLLALKISGILLAALLKELLFLVKIIRYLLGQDYVLGLRK